MKLKVCGMREPTNIVAVAALQPDYLGFIFYDRSKRYVPAETLLPHVSASIQKVGVFVNASFQQIIDRIEKFQLEVVQLHGEEPPALCAQLQAAGLTVVKVFGIGNTFDFKVLSAYEKVVDFFLFDTKGEERGGNGQSFNWELLRTYPSKVPLWLSGGISLGNIEHLLELIERLQLPVHAIDVNSRFEVMAGLKDVQKIKKLKTVIDLKKS
ncbi:MAG: phosphoribosylanthranilate isomerase [Thermonemataceae bacterium]